MNIPDKDSLWSTGRTPLPGLVGSRVLVLSFLLYLFTLAPTVIWGDSASFAVQAVSMEFGVGAESHSLYILLGRLFSYLPFEVAYSMNLLSAVTASLALLMVYLIILEMTGSLASSIIGAASLCVSHAFWLHAVIPEVYDLNALFVTGIFLVLLKWHKSPKDPSLLYGAAFLFGLGLTNHLILGLTVFGFLFFVVLSDPKILLRFRVLCFTLFSFIIGSSFLIFLVLQRFVKGRTVVAMADAATGGIYKKSMFVISAKIIRDLFMYLAYLSYQFPIAGFVLGAIGIFAIYKENRKPALCLFSLIGVNMAFFLTFGPGVMRTTKYTFYIADYSIFSILIGYGFFAFGRFWQSRGYTLKSVSAGTLCLVILLPLFLYTVTPYASRKLSIDILHARTLPYRDNEEFFLFPGKRGYTGAEKYAEEVLKTATIDAVIIADWTPYTVLRYYQVVKGIRKDILLFFPANNMHKDTLKKISDNYWKRDIYLAGIEKGYYPMNKLSKEYDIVPEGLLYKLVKKRISANTIIYRD